VRGAGKLDVPSGLCVDPLWLGGLRGEKSILRIGLEVPMKSHRSVSESETEWTEQRLEVGDFGYGTHAFILEGRLLLTIGFHFYTFN
jgi:hypothetical protein